MINFFPPVLGKGSIDRGTRGPIRFYQNLLIALDCAVSGLQADGDYGQLTADSTMLLQKNLGIKKPCGNLGSGTCAAIKEQIGINLLAIPGDETLASSVDYVDPDTMQKKTWPHRD